MYNANTPYKRPVWKDGQKIGTVTMSLNDKDFINKIQKSFFIGFTEEEHDLIQNGSEETLLNTGIIKKV